MGKKHRSALDTTALQEFLDQIGSATSDLIFSNSLSSVYHYTDLFALKGIIETGDLWLTNSRYSNDDEEILHGFAGVREVIEGEMTRAPWQTQEFYQAVSAILQTPSPEGVYICSFCEANNLLSQWRGYGANGTGVCLEFDPAGFSFFTGSDSPPRGLARLWSVFYDKNVQRQIVSDALCFDRPGLSSMERARLVADIILFFVPTFKNADFAEEKEIRLIFTPKPEFALRPEFRVSRGMLTPFYRLRTLAGDATNRTLPLRKVLIGPSRHKAIILEATRMMLDANGLEHVDVELSKTPYRG